MLCYTTSVGILDLLFPKYCVNCKKLGSYLCTACFSYLSFNEQNICLVCNKPSIDALTHPICQGKYVIDGCFSAIAYKGVVRKLIFKFKYKPYLTDLNSTLVDLFYESLIQQEGFLKILKTNPVLISIPLHSTKLKSRGYNHAQILADELAKRLNLTSLNIIKRIKKTASQYGLKREERKKNLSGAFSVCTDIDTCKYPNILLIDDILTTGATLSEAARVLKKAGAKQVWGVTLAKD